MNLEKATDTALCERLQWLMAKGESVEEKADAEAVTLEIERRGRQ